VAESLDILGRRDDDVDRDAEAEEVQVDVLRQASPM
jgi:hypothetical protein